MSKDKAWLKDKVEEMRMYYSLSNNLDFVSKRQAIDEFKLLIDQLDEPEITEEQAWNKIAESYPADAKSLVVAFEHFYYEGFAKKELPVIPQFVADWIEKWKEEGLTISGWFAFDYYNEEDVKVHNWLYDNEYEENTRREYLLIDAIRYGYKVKKYRIHDKTTKNYLGYNDDRTRLNWYTYRFGNHTFTEDEIKAIDERYWAFAEEVTG